MFSIPANWGEHWKTEKKTENYESQEKLLPLKGIEVPWRPTEGRLRLPVALQRRPTWHKEAVRGRRKKKKSQTGKWPCFAREGCYKAATRTHKKRGGRKEQERNSACNKRLPGSRGSDRGQWGEGRAFSKNPERVAKVSISKAARKERSYS